MKLFGTAPYGYSKSNGKTTIVTEEKTTLDLIFELLLNDNSRSQVVEYLNKNNILSRKGGSWDLNNIKKILDPKRLNFYAGENNDFPIISEEFKNRIMGLKNLYPNMSRNVNKGNIYLLTKNKDMQITCGYCGGSLKTMLSTTTNYYYCSNKECTNRHGHKQKVIDIEVLKELDFIIGNIDKYKDLIDIQYKVNTDKALQLIAKKQENIIKTANLLNNVNLDEYNTLISQINNIANYGNELITGLMTKYVFSIKQNEINIHAVSLDKQKEVLSALVNKIVLFIDAMEIYFRFPINTDLKSVVTISMLSSDKN